MPRFKQALTSIRLVLAAAGLLACLPMLFNWLGVVAFIVVALTGSF